jgi:hypothetical protein
MNCRLTTTYHTIGYVLCGTALGLAVALLIFLASGHR